MVEKQQCCWLSRAVITLGVMGVCSFSEAGLPREFTLNRPAAGQFYLDYNDGDGVINRVVSYGAAGDLGLLADVDGDTLADLILYRAGVWFVDLMNNGTVDRSFFLGNPSGGDIPLVGDFLGQGRAGFGVYRIANGVWYLDRDGNGSVDHQSTFGGAAQDRPVVADYDRDGRADRAVFRAGVWYVDRGFNGSLDAIYQLGGLPQDVPVAADFDGDWRADNAVFRDGIWYIDYGNNSTVDRIVAYGAAGDRPFVAPVNPASSRFVRGGGGGGACTQVAPCGTIADALAVAVAGDKIRVAAGTYPENVFFVGRQNLTFVGAGVGATHLQGGGTADAFVAQLSSDITLQNLHVASPTNRGIIAQASEMTLDRVSTVGNFSHNVLAGSYLGTAATLFVFSSNIDASQAGNGLRLETPAGASTTTVVDSTIDGNGTSLAPGDPDLQVSGRGIEVFGTSHLTLDSTSVSANHFGGALFTHSTSAVIHDSVFIGNGHNGIYFEQTTTGDLYRNTFNGNGTLGTFGPFGFNGIEIGDGYAGPQMLIHENSFDGNTTNGVYVGGGTVTVANNTMRNNFVGVTLHNPTNVTIRGNVFQSVEPSTQYGVFMEGAGVTATIGGAGANQNTFRDYVGNPSIVCAGLGEAPVCPASGNLFPGSSPPLVSGCPGTCTP